MSELIDYNNMKTKPVNFQYKEMYKIIIPFPKNI